MSFSKYVLESSDSADSEEEVFLLAALVDSVPSKKRRKIVKVNHYDASVIAKMDYIQFKKVFRMNKNTMERIAREFLHSIYYPYAKEFYKTQEQAERILLSFLWYASNNVVYAKTAPIFGFGETNLVGYFDAILKFFNEECCKYILFPKTSNQKLLMSKEFEKITGFPGVIGCIDGTYIPVKTPAHKIRSTYVNRHEMISITLQAVCSPNRKFMDISVGYSSKIHDARIYKLSGLEQNLSSMCGPNYHLLGDAAYPIGPNLLTPFRCPDGSSSKSNYNYRLAQTRVLIENAFGILKSRWRQLDRVRFTTVEKISYFVKACCVLHNLCIERNDLWEDEFQNENEENDVDQDTDADENETDVNENEIDVDNEVDNGNEPNVDPNSKAQGETKRNNIMDYLCTLDRHRGYQRQ